MRFSYATLTFLASSNCALNAVATPDSVNIDKTIYTMITSDDPTLIRAFVVGCGSIGKRHIRNLLQLGIRDIIIFDSNLNVAETVAAEFGVSSVKSVESGISWDPMIAMICVPNHLHISVAAKLAETGINLFIEKPLDIQLQGIESLIEVVNKKHLINMVACNFRFDPGLSLFKTMLDGGKIGTTYSLKASFGYYLPDWRPGTDYRATYAAKESTGGGVLFDRIHEFDYVLWLMGDVTQIEGFAAKIGNLEIETEDDAEIVFVHSSGTVSNIHLDYLRPEYNCSCEVVGSKGILYWDYKKRTVMAYDASVQKWTDYSYKVPADPNTMYVEELRYFLGCVSAKSPSCNSVRDAMRTLEIVLETRRKILKEHFH